MMKLKQLAIAAAMTCSFTLPSAAKASETATLNGWGALFAAAHAGQSAAAQGQAQGEFKLDLFKRQPAPATQPAPEAMPSPAPAPEPTPVAQAPDMEQPATGDQTASTGNAVGESAEAGQQQGSQAMASANASLQATVTVSGEQLGKVLDKVDSVYQAAGTVVDGAAERVSGTLQGLAGMGNGAGLTSNLSQSGNLNVAGLASASMASSLGATASVMNAGQLGAISAVTSGLIQSIIAARPASLTSLLR
ncbi:MAG TPA: hypothetical protein VFV28_06755 [Limnobacter sp.]|nr:hypothetical protein [Limnobacter sp.]